MASAARRVASLVRRRKSSGSSGLGWRAIAARLGMVLFDDRSSSADGEFAQICRLDNTPYSCAVHSVSNSQIKWLVSKASDSFSFHTDEMEIEHRNREQVRSGYRARDIDAKARNICFKNTSAKVVGETPPFRHWISGDCHDASYTVHGPVVFGSAKYA